MPALNEICRQPGEREKQEIVVAEGSDERSPHSTGAEQIEKRDIGLPRRRPIKVASKSGGPSSQIHTGLEVVKSTRADRSRKGMKRNSIFELKKRTKYAPITAAMAPEAPTSGMVLPACLAA